MKSLSYNQQLLSNRHEDKPASAQGPHEPNDNNAGFDPEE